jgi:hypothetical protein
MRLTELRLSEADRAAINGIRMKGLHQAREVNRAHVLASLDQGVPEAQIMAVLGIGRAAVWRARAAYLQGRLDLAVVDLARSCRPPRYDTDAEAHGRAQPDEAGLRVRAQRHHPSAAHHATIAQQTAQPHSAGRRR